MGWMASLKRTMSASLLHQPSLPHTIILSVSMHVDSTAEESDHGESDSSSSSDEYTDSTADERHE